MSTDKILGYAAASTTILAFGSQFIHTVRSKTIEGVSVSRSVLDTVSLTLWVLYATRIDDNPLLIATGCELFLSLCVCLLLMKHRLVKGQSIGNCTMITITNADHVQVNVLAAGKTPPLAYAVERPQAKAVNKQGVQRLDPTQGHVGLADLEDPLSDVDQGRIQGRALGLVNRAGPG